MTETAFPTSFVAMPRTGERGGYENECFTHYVQGNGGRCCLRGPMVQLDVEWLANNMNSATEPETVWQVKRTACASHPRSVVLATECLSKCLPFPLDRQQCRDADNREQKERPWECDVVVHASLDVADYLLRGRTG